MIPCQIVNSPMNNYNFMFLFYSLCFLRNIAKARNAGLGLVRLYSDINFNNGVTEEITIRLLIKRYIIIIIRPNGLFEIECHVYQSLFMLGARVRLQL